MVRASLNLSARFTESSIYYYESYSNLAVKDKLYLFMSVGHVSLATLRQL